jgi:hypothetical protein
MRYNNERQKNRLTGWTTSYRRFPKTKGDFFMVTDVNEKVNRAFLFGKEDALQEVDQRGSSLYQLCSDEWHSYNDGYAAGCKELSEETGRIRQVCKF